YRYAENIAAGHGWRWNIEEPPVWGASAPLWPLVVALGIKAGLSAVDSALIWSAVFAFAATGLLGWLAQRLYGVLGVVALAPVLAINCLYSTWALSSMETSMTYA